MPEYLLRIEGVNLSGFIEDTEDLSTIRGGSLLLLEAPARLAPKFEAPDRLAPEFPELTIISTATSIGIFTFDAANDDAAEKKRSKVAKFLAYEDERLKYATFVVDVAPNDPEHFQTALETVTAKNRWRQFQQPTVVVPEKNSAADIKKACELDRIRPGTVGEGRHDEKIKISKSVNARRLYGIMAKQKFYKTILQKHLQEPFGVDFVHEFQELTCLENHADPLHHKMAVIYADGNRFGKIREQCHSAVELKEFSKHLQKCQAKALQNLLTWMDQPSDYCMTHDGKFRLETLLWGGDELIWVVPAGIGWEVLAGLFQQVETWSALLDEVPEWPHKGQNLTVAAGLVFCHHVAPIHRIVKLVKDLADEAKKKSRDQNLFQYLVLESFDHIGQDLEAYRKIHCPWVNCHSLEGDGMRKAAKNIRNLRKDFPHKHLTTANQALLAKSRPGSPDPKPFDDFKKRLAETWSHEAEAAWNQILASNFFGDEPSLWTHVADLWDYIPDEEAGQ